MKKSLVLAVALTGGSAGLGLAPASAVTSDGYYVVVCARYAAGGDFSDGEPRREGLVAGMGKSPAVAKRQAQGAGNGAGHYVGDPCKQSGPMGYTAAMDIVNRTHG
jgi:NAD(P)-dependent dehydrogenase (short-subunit alcohol dehydrogenase family)